MSEVHPGTQIPVPNPAEAQHDVDPIVRQMEVVSHVLDTLPPSSDLAHYLAKPAKEPVYDGDKPVTYKDADYPEMDVVKDSVTEALEVYRQGGVGTMRLMYGSVNAMYDAHRHSKNNPNLRIAFEDLADFNITGSHNFHSMMNPAGETVGTLEPEPISKGWGVGPENGAILAKGAARILDGDISVMFKGFEGKLHDKMYGMKDPETGELLPNTFMVIMSGTYFDQKGSDSPLSNLASARIVMIPQEMIDVARQPQEVAESSFDIDSVDWSVFGGQFNVERSGGKVDRGGWTIKDPTPWKDEFGAYRVRIYGHDSSKGGPVHKDVKVEDLVNWQKPEQQSN